METLVVNLSGRVRRDRLYGKDYLVAPLTLIVPGVLNGSKGPLLYPPEEVGKDPSIWNGVPIVVNHPSENGMAISARSPDVLNKQGIGFVFRSKMGEALGAEGWFDVDSTARIAPKILTKLQNNESIELSTGLFTDNFLAPPDSIFNSKTGKKSYKYIARNYRPDHLAILPDQVGACSLKDGCGVLANQESEGEIMTENKQTLWQKLGEMLGITDNAFCPTGKGGGVDPTCGGGSGGSRGDANLSSHNEGYGFHGAVYKNSLGDKANQTAHEQFRKAAKEIAEKYNLTSEEARNYLDSSIGRHVGERVASGLNIHDAMKDYHVSSKHLKKSLKEIQDQTKEGVFNNQLQENEETGMKDSEKKVIVDNLISNCGECGWTEDDRETLNKLSDKTLTVLDNQRKTLALNQIVVNAVKEITDNETDCDKMVVALQEKLKAKEPTKVDNQEKKEEEKKEVIANLSQQDQDDLAFARRLKSELKQRHIATITANSGNKFTAEQLDKMSLETLEGMASLAKVEQTINKEQEAVMNYLGSAVAPQMRSTEADRKNILPMSTIDWSKKA